MVIQAGSGQYGVVVTVSDGMNPIEGAFVRMSNYTLQTPSTGQVTFNLNAATFTLSVMNPGCTYTPTSYAISAPTSITATMTVVSLPAPPAQVLGSTITTDSGGTPIPEVTLIFRLLNPGSNTCSAGASLQSTSDNSGNLLVLLLPSATYLGQRGSGLPVEFTTPASGSFVLPDVVG